MLPRLTWLTVTVLLTLGSSAGFAAADTLTLRYYGQSFFLITTGGGTRIVLDPFGNIGFPMPSGVDADAVFITHEHGDHNNAALIGGGAKVFRGLTITPLGWNAIRERVGDALVYSVPSFHDNEGGTSGRGFNTLLVVEANGLRIAHLGDLGQTALTDTQLRALGRVDVLLVPVGARRSRSVRRRPPRSPNSSNPASSSRCITRPQRARRGRGRTSRASSPGSAACSAPAPPSRSPHPRCPASGRSWSWRISRRIDRCMPTSS